MVDLLIRSTQERELITGWRRLQSCRWRPGRDQRDPVRGTRRPRTKSGHARRVPFTEAMAKAIQERRKRLLALQAPGLDTGLCFPSEAGKARCASVMDKPFARICKEAGIKKKLSTKVFRRTITSGAPEWIPPCTSIVGHATDRMQDVYSSVGPKERLQALAGVLGPLRGA